ncbi:shugoshin 2 isoform X1 [Malaclemys terrapin pileata]|uniref:shugoshin 2 isoform X1 n=2 Tax=Malaclemys terrapin pileata TaxID=2991368 RepID=UPI0023A8CCC9|nr:shugoshin 2 isoform X1 [Malaclemys terrapin pileata]XP_053899200.1 shugoshin 2 isoform X1 [Malaclemys terrapin pileata]
MANQATAETSSIFSLGSIRGHTKEKKDRALKAAKLNASLASKIKTKIINNSSIFKISLKHNNKALALALTLEKENTRRLKNEKIFLQKEVEELHFHNVVLRQKLNCLNKTLIEIEAFMNSNLLTAIEMSSFSEHIQNPLTVPSGQSSCVDHQSKTSYHSVRSVGMPMKVPLIAVHKAKQQGSPSLCEKSEDLCNLTSVVSNEICPAQISVELLLESEKNKQKSNEIDKMETIFDSNIFFRENQPCTLLSSNSALMSDLDNVPSVGQSEEFTKPHDSPLPLCGNVTERKKHATSCRSNTDAGIADFNKKVTPSNVSDWSIDEGNTTNEMSVQAKPNVLSHPDSPLHPSNEFKTNSNEVHFGNQLKPEETVYDTEMELTASDVGKILTITSKAQNKRNSSAKTDKISANLRKVRYSNTGKKDKEKIKSNPKGSSDFHSEKRHKNTEKIIDSNTSESDTPKFRLEAEQMAKRNALGELTLQRTDEHDVQNSQYNDKATRRTYLVNLASPSKQQKTDLQQKINKQILSERLENMDKFQNPDSSSSNSKAPSKDYCTKSVPCIENHISGVLSLQQDLVDVNEKHIKPKRNCKTFQIPSTISKTNDCREEIEEHSASSSKQPGAKACKPDCKTKQHQKSECHKEDNYSDRREPQTSSHCVDIKKIERKSNKVSLDSSKNVLAKASLKTNIQPDDFTQCTLSVRQELKNENMLHTDIVHGNKITNTQQIQGILDIKSSVTVNKQWARSSLKKVDEYNVNMLKKGVDRISKANKKTCIVISPDDQIKNNERLISETRLEECDIRQVDQVEQNILDDQKVRTRRDPFMNKLINKSVLTNIMIEEPCLLKFSPVTCSKDMLFNSCNFLQEGFPHMELSAVDYHKISENFPVLKNSKIFEKSNYEKVLCANRAKKMETDFKVSCQKLSGTGSGRKALQDQTNTSLYSDTSLPKLQDILEKNSIPARRRRTSVCYKEPKISSKLRRGDQFTDMEFLNSPVFKVKNKRSFKSKPRLI